MVCPQCQSDEISPSGVCLVCGYRIEADAPAAKPTADEKSTATGMIEMECSGGEHELTPKEELPQWRQELSQRLQAIKQKREQSATAGQPKVVPAVLQEKPLSEKPPVRRPAPIPLRPVHAGAGKPSKPPSPIPRQKILEPVKADAFSEKPATKAADSRQIQELIDNAVSRRSTTAPSPAAGIASSVSRSALRQEGKLILLSRTLSGLIDLIVVVLCTGGFILAADYFAGIVILDSISLFDYSALFLMTHILYSIFFLAACGQTIGMMITDLRVVGSGRKRPSLSRLLGRCLGYLLSLLVLGIGLLWSLFDSESLCLHDRVSLTRVVRVDEPLSLS